MTDRPVIFSAPMIRALLDGRKTQTRRILRPQPDPPPGFDGWAGFSCLCPPRHYEMRGYDEDLGPIIRHRPLRFWNGDRLWVREAWKSHSIYATRAPRDIPHSKVFYRADDSYAPSNTRWVPSIHMPRWASRLTLIVESVKVERLQDISEANAIAEGIGKSPHGNGDQWLDYPEGSSAAGWLDPRTSFQTLWKSINGADSWDANPCVAAIAFRAVKANIDALCEEVAP